MEKKALTIIDIANQLDVSQATISCILNGKSKERRISDDTTERVLKFIKKVGYKPNLLARSFRTGKTNIIGLMVESISNPFFANLARLIEENAYKNGYKILYCSTENNLVKAKGLLQMFKERHIDGYIITPTEGLKDDIDKLAKGDVPIILFDRYFETGNNDYVILDNFKSAHDAVKHLMEQDYKAIGFVTINSLQSQMLGRLDGYKKAINENQLKHYVKEIDTETNKVTVVEQIVDFLAKHKQLDAVLFSTIYLGIDGLKAIKQLELKIPSDIAIISFDENVIFELHSPAITTIEQPIETMSVQLINILLDKMAAKNSVSHKVTLPGKLIVRASSMKKI